MSDVTTSTAVRRGANIADFARAAIFPGHGSESSAHACPGSTVLTSASKSAVRTSFLRRRTTSLFRNSTHSDQRDLNLERECQSFKCKKNGSGGGSGRKSLISFVSFLRRLQNITSCQMEWFAMALRRIMQLKCIGNASDVHTSFSEVDLRGLKTFPAAHYHFFDCPAPPRETILRVTPLKAAAENSSGLRELPPTLPRGRIVKMKNLDALKALRPRSQAHRRSQSRRISKE